MRYLDWVDTALLPLPALPPASPLLPADTPPSLRRRSASCPAVTHHAGETSIVTSFNGGQHVSPAGGVRSALSGRSSAALILPTGEAGPLVQFDLRFVRAPGLRNSLVW